MISIGLNRKERNLVLDTTISLEELHQWQVPRLLLSFKKNNAELTDYFGLSNLLSVDGFEEWSGIGANRIITVSGLLELRLHPYFITWVIYKTPRLPERLKHIWALSLCSGLIESNRKVLSPMLYKQFTNLMEKKSAYLNRSESLGNLYYGRRKAEALLADCAAFGSPAEVELAYAVKTLYISNPFTCIETVASQLSEANAPADGYAKILETIASSLR